MLHFYSCVSEGCLLTFVGPPEPLHAISVQGHPGKLPEALSNVEIAQRAHLEERHVVLCSICLRLSLANLPLERQVESVAHQHLGHSGGMLQHFFFIIFTFLFLCCAM